MRPQDPRVRGAATTSKVLVAILTVLVARYNEYCTSNWATVRVRARLCISGTSIRRVPYVAPCAEKIGKGCSLSGFPFQ